MKKYLFTLLGLPILIGLTNAGSINVSCNGEQGLCRPTNFTIPESENITATINNCPYSETANFNINFSNGGGNNGLSIQGSCEDPYINREGSKAGTYNGGYFIVDDPECELNCEEYEEDSEEQEQCYSACNEGTDGTLTFTINYTENNQNQGGAGGGTEGGIVSGGINAFSGIIERVGSIAGEFLPYIIYIAMFCLGISLLFKAVKGLLGFTDKKAKNSITGRGTMQERRTYRRKMRRRRKYDNEDHRYKILRKTGISEKGSREQAKYMTKNRRRIRKNNGAY